MQVGINGEPHELPDGAGVADAVVVAVGDADRAAAGAGLAVAVNGDVVPREEWSQVTLRAGDAVEVLTAFAGG